MNNEGIPIFLTKGYVAYVDPEDAYLVGYMWSASEAKNGRVYACSRMGKRGPLYKLHRIVLGVTDPTVDVDHLDGDGLNCRKGNLMEKTRSANMANREAARSDSGSGIIGVAWHKPARKWVATIRVGGKRHYLGLHETAEAATVARLQKEKELIGIQPRRLEAFKKAGLC